MPPKKAKNQESVKEEICQYYNRGYCKHKKDCSKLHSDKVCDDTDCNEEECTKRHPNPCKFGFRCIFNKLKKCLYSHVNLAPDNDKVNDLVKTMNNKLENFEVKMKLMQKGLDEKNTKIKLLQDKCEVLEKSVNKFEQKDNKTKEEISKLEKKLETLIKKSEAHEKSNDAMFSNLEKLVEESKNKFKCDKCTFSSTSESGLKTHMTKKHNKKKSSSHSHKNVLFVTRF